MIQTTFVSVRRRSGFSSFLCSGHLTLSKLNIQFGTQVKFRWSRDRNDRTAENAFSAPWFFSEMELEPAAD